MSGFIIVRAHPKRLVPTIFATDVCFTRRLNERTNHFKHNLFGRIVNGFAC
jgi:hypothetical protein